MQAAGNQEVVELLRAALAYAQDGRVGFAALMLLEDNPGRIACEIAGAVNFHEPAERGCDALRAKIAKSRMDREAPAPDPALGADHVCYNAALGPLSYDFIPWLADAEMTRIRERAPAPLRVGFWFGKTAYTGLNREGAEQMFRNVVRPALALIGAVEDPAAIRGRCKEVYTTRDIAAAARAGEAVPRFRAPEAARHSMWLWFKSEYVTITLREATHWPHRNSNIPAWVAFARLLRERGERVIFVRDTAHSRAPLEDMTICPLAAEDLHCRMALYENARANLFVSNGPSSLAFFTDRPWLQFMDLKPDGHPYRPDTPSFFHEHMGVEPGGQYPWSGPEQRLVYAPDHYENIVAAWDALALEGP